MSSFRCLSDGPCVYCKYLNRVDCDYIYCKKYMNGSVFLTRFSHLTSCGNFKPRKDLKFICFNDCKGKCGGKVDE